MRYKLLGNSGLRVSEVCLGAMTFGEEFGWGASKDESRRVFDAFVEHGGNFIDTANFYTAGTSEKYVGEFVAKERERFVVATKYTSNTRPGDPNAGGNHRKNFTQALEASLKRLNTDYIDLYWLHAWDFTTPVEEIMRAFDDAVRSGKILYCGISDAPAWIIAQANTVANLRGWTLFVGLQIEYNLIARTPERELLPMARAFDLGVTAWSPLASGVLTGKYSQKTGEERRLDKVQFVKMTERNLAIAEAVTSVAGHIGRTPSQVALSWLRQQNTIPILGARKHTQIVDNLGCLDLVLDEKQMRQLDEASRIELGFPHDFLAADHIREVVFGGTFDRLDNHHRR
jgi:aryl-alcohol dehydrogenase-like predicted oxidoreductase